MKEEKFNLDFSNNLNYTLQNLKKAIDEASNLEDKIYLELSKNEIIEYLNCVYTNIKCWKNDYELKKYENITNNYKNVNSIISQLELCLADYDKIFHMDGISYSIFQIGKILPNIIKGGDKNGR